MKRTTTFILVADGSRARLLTDNGSRNSELSAVPNSCLAAAEQEEERDRPGRVHESVGSARHSIEPRDTHRRQAERRFAREVATMVSDKSDACDRLIVVAAPKSLGDLREFFAEAVREKVHAEIDKDLTHLSNEALREALADYL